MAKRKRQNTGEAVIEPPAERWERGEVEAMPHAIADEDGRPAKPFRVIDTLTAMERRGTITKEMRQAGEQFRDDFAMAAFEPLRAADVLRVSSGGKGSGGNSGQLDAKDRVWKALTALGGPASPAGACAWHVLGIGSSIVDWAIREGWGGGRPIHKRTAAGILVGALGVLEKHYGLT